LLQVSNDNGTTWTDYDLRGATSVNSLNSTTGAKLESINVSDVAGNQPNVLFRFNMQGAAAYWWQIDDIAIVEGGDNDLILNRAYIDFGYKNGGYYTKMPISQVRPLEFRTAYRNDGKLTQHNIKSNVTIIKSGTAVFNKFSPIKDSLVTLAYDTLGILADSAFIPSAIGIYNTTVTISQTESDQKISNNSAIKTFEVTADEFAFDNDNYQSSGSTSSSDYVGGDADGSIMGTIFEIGDAVATDKVKFHLDCATGDVGAIYRTVIYKLTSASVDLVFQSDDDTVKTTNRNTWVTKNIPIFNFEANTSYVVGLELVDGSSATKAIVFADDEATEQPGVNTFVYFAGDAAPDWGGVRATPFIRLIVRTDVGVQEIAPKSTISAFPNPTSGLLNVALKNTSNAIVKLVDLNGRTVFSENVSNKFNLTIDMSNLAKGIYSLQVISNNGVETKKVMKQ
jgi:hypothetical protein